MIDWDFEKDKTREKKLAKVTLFKHMPFLVAHDLSNSTTTFPQTAKPWFLINDLFVVSCAAVDQLRAAAQASQWLYNSNLHDSSGHQGLFPFAYERMASLACFFLMMPRPIWPSHDGHTKKCALQSYVYGSPAGHGRATKKAQSKPRLSPCLSLQDLCDQAALTLVSFGISLSRCWEYSCCGFSNSCSVSATSSSWP